MSARLAWIAFSLVVLLNLGGSAFAFINLEETHPELSAFDPVVIIFFVFPIVGVLVAARQPHNPIGWILLGIGFAWGLFSVLSGYALYALVVNPGSLPRADLVLALNSWTWVPAVGLMGTFLLLLFPDGHLPSPKWRPLAWLSAVTMTVLSVVSVIWPGPFENSGFPNVTNPLGVETLKSIIEAVDIAAVVAFLGCIAGCAFGVIQRFRRSRGLERLQLKWLAAGGTTAAAAYLILMATAAYYSLTNTPTPLWVARAVEGGAFLSFLLIPLAIGIAILRHRLYDIDVIINRALVYGALTAALAMVYSGGVVGVGSVVRAITHQESNNLAVAASTLAVAALFGPLRRRVQSFIDRRFYRHKYDAEETVADFSARLRDQVDLDSLNADLVGVVTRTMQPSHISLWLRSPTS